MPEGTPHLLVFQPDGQSSKYILSKREVLLGRSGACDLQLLDQSVSREHARITFSKGQWIIRDLRSVNGTYLNKKIVAKGTLRPGDEIILGVYRMHFVSHPEPSGVPEPTDADQETDLSTLTRIIVLDEKTPAKLAKAARLKNISVQTVAGEDPLGRIIGCSAHIREVKELICSAAESDAPVLVRGDTGTGKELVAQAIAKLSRNRKPYAVAVNLAAVDPRLAAAELFGHGRGAFTDADRERKGMIELADGATLFLDEVGNAPSEVQSMLLRVLETGEVMPIGVRKVKQVDIRVVAATNRDLREMMRQGLFSDALYFRLCQFEIQLLPLREKVEDILLLARHFLAVAAESRGVHVPSLSSDAAALLCSYQWPGNVRELKGCMEYALAVGKSSEIMPSHLVPRVRGGQELGERPSANRTRTLGRRVLLVDALRQTGGNQSQAARILGVSRQAVHQMIRRFEVEEAEWQ